MKIYLINVELCIMSCLEIMLFIKTCYEKDILSELR